MTRSREPTKDVVRVKLTPTAIKLCKHQGEEANRNLSQQIEHLINNNPEGATNKHGR